MTTASSCLQPARHTLRSHLHHRGSKVVRGGEPTSNPSEVNNFLESKPSTSRTVPARQSSRSSWFGRAGQMSLYSHQSQSGPGAGDHSVSFRIRSTSALVPLLESANCSGLRVEVSREVSQVCAVACLKSCGGALNVASESGFARNERSLATPQGTILVKSNPQRCLNLELTRNQGCRAERCRDVLSASCRNIIDNTHAADRRDQGLGGNRGNV